MEVNQYIVKERFMFGIGRGLFGIAISWTNSLYDLPSVGLIWVLRTEREEIFSIFCPSAGVSIESLTVPPAAADYREFELAVSNFAGLSASEAVRDSGKLHKEKLPKEYDTNL